jgi:hypothetical protein
MSANRERSHSPQEPDTATLRIWEAEAAAEPPDHKSWADLIIQLRWNAERERIRPSPATDLPAGLDSSIFALRQLTMFIQRQPHFIRHPEDLKQIARLYEALLGLRRGHTSPMLKVRRPKSRPENGVGYETVKGTAARAMSELVKGKAMRPNEAARVVARACGATAKKVERWREMMEQGPGPGAPEGGAALFAYRKPLPPNFGDTPSERGKKLLESLRAEAREWV